MAVVAPNLSTLIGEVVAARLIQKAGSLTSLAKCPASTVQILGAEKALFRSKLLSISLIRLTEHLRPRATLPNMVLSITLHLLEEPLRKIKGVSLVILPINAQLLLVLILLLMNPPMHMAFNFANKLKRDCLSMILELLLGKMLMSWRVSPIN